MDHFDYKNGVLHAENCDLRWIAERVGTPFYCYSTATLERHYQVFAESFAGMPIKICYAVKANGNLGVLRTLAQLGSGADVVSQGEIRLALRAGIAPENIVFSGVGKTREEMDYALAQRIFQFNVESEPELEALNAAARAAGRRAAIAIRVNPDVIPYTHAKISTGQKESKFGIPISAARSLYARAAALSGITVQGVSVHIGSQLTQLAPFREAFTRVAELVAMLRSDGHAITTVDLGGGLGIPYSDEAPPVPAEYARIVKETVGHLNTTLIFEPGRLLVGNAGILVTRVIYVKQAENRTFVIVDAGMNDLIRPTLYAAYHEMIPVMQPASEVMPIPVDVVGPVCETGDIFAENRMLPLPVAGGLIAFRSAGAYGATMSCTYNARPLVPEVMVKADAFRIVRRRPSYEEMTALESIPEW